MSFSQSSTPNWKKIKASPVEKCWQQRRLVPVTHVVFREHFLRSICQAQCSSILFRVMFSVWQSFHGPQCHSPHNRGMHRAPRGDSIRQPCWGPGHQGKGEGKAVMPPFLYYCKTVFELRPWGWFYFLNHGWVHVKIMIAETNILLSTYYGGRHNAKCFKYIASFSPHN